MNENNSRFDGASSGLALGGTEMVPEEEAPTNFKQTKRTSLSRTNVGQPCPNGYGWFVGCVLCEACEHYRHVYTIGQPVEGFCVYDNSEEKTTQESDNFRKLEK